MPGFEARLLQQRKLIDDEKARIIKESEDFEERDRLKGEKKAQIKEDRKEERQRLLDVSRDREEWQQVLDLSENQDFLRSLELYFEKYGLGKSFKDVIEKDSVLTDQDPYLSFRVIGGYIYFRFPINNERWPFVEFRIFYNDGSYPNFFDYYVKGSPEDKIGFDHLKHYPNHPSPMATFYDENTSSMVYRFGRRYPEDIDPEVMGKGKVVMEGSRDYYQGLCVDIAFPNDNFDQRHDFYGLLEDFYKHMIEELV